MKCISKENIFPILILLLVSTSIINNTAYAANFNVVIDTAELQTFSGFLAFDFIDGDLQNNNSVTITSLDTDGSLGSLTTEGDVNGTLQQNNLVIGDYVFFNSYVQRFQTFGKYISFNVEITNNGSFTPAPDNFSVFLLDITGNQYHTDNPYGPDSIINIAINDIHPQFTSYILDRIGSPLIQILATDTEAAEENQDPAEVVFTRFYHNKTPPLTIDYDLSGTATNGTDYKILSGRIVIPSEKDSVSMTITPINDNIIEPTETVIITLKPSTEYRLDNIEFPQEAIINIINNNNIISPHPGSSAPQSIPVLQGGGLFFMILSIIIILQKIVYHSKKAFL